MTRSSAQAVVLTNCSRRTYESQEKKKEASNLQPEHVQDPKESVRGDSPGAVDGTNQPVLACSTTGNA